VRTGDITKEDFRATLQELAEDIRSGTIRLAFFGDSDKREAAALLEKYGSSRNLRTLDAMQLAVIKRLGTHVIRDVYCADRPFIDLIEAEGFSVLNPEAPPETREVREE
jgi:hypothetical protein